jgi:hypothetical protein
VSSNGTECDAMVLQFNVPFGETLNSVNTASAPSRLVPDMMPMNKPELFCVLVILK